MKRVAVFAALMLPMVATPAFATPADDLHAIARETQRANDAADADRIRARSAEIERRAEEDHRRYMDESARRTQELERQNAARSAPPAPSAPSIVYVSAPRVVEAARTRTWVLVGSTGDGASMWYDRSSVASIGGTRIVDLRIGNSVDSGDDTWVIDCPTKTSAIVITGGTAARISVRPPLAAKKGTLIYAGIMTVCTPGPTAAR